jgi:hydroxyacylglutathione hydrolase
MLYDSIFTKLLPLGDQTLLFPAHGAGSVCGDNMANREFSSIGYEKMNNPALQVENRDEFVERKINEHHDQPAYFRRMEQYNLEGAPPLHVLKTPPPMSAGEVADRVDHGAVLVDLRSPEAFAGAFIPGSLAIPLEMIPAYAGYLLDYEWDVILIPETVDQIATAFRYLVRMGYDRVPGYLKGGMHAWEISGGEYERIGAVHAHALTKRIEGGDQFTLLDVRKKPEFEAGHVKSAQHIFLGELQDRLGELDRGKPVVTFCGSGQRAIIAASILKRHGFEEVSDSLGSMAACRKSGCPMA